MTKHSSNFPTDPGCPSITLQRIGYEAHLAHGTAKTRGILVSCEEAIDRAHDKIDNVSKKGLFAMGVGFCALGAPVAAIPFFVGSLITQWIYKRHVKQSDKIFKEAYAGLDDCLNPDANVAEESDACHHLKTAQHYVERWETHQVFGKNIVKYATSQLHLFVDLALAFADTREEVEKQRHPKKLPSTSLNGSIGEVLCALHKKHAHQHHHS